MDLRIVSCKEKTTQPFLSGNIVPEVTLIKSKLFPFDVNVINL